MMKTSLVSKALGLAAAACLVSQTAWGQISTSPLQLLDSITSPTGAFHWDTFDLTTGNPAFIPQEPDVTELGGQASLSAGFAAQPMDGPPVPLVTSTANIYSGGTLLDWTVSLTDLIDADSFTTVVFQLSTLGSIDESSLLLDGAAPTEFMNRGVFADIAHGASGAPFDTTYYWAEWQVAASDSYDITFTHPLTHTSFTEFKVDYINGASVFNASAVPEPETLFVVALGLLATCGLGVHLRRRGRSGPG